MNKIRERLKEIRKNKNLTQKDIANILNISSTCYAGYEQGYREPNADMIIKICSIFDVTTDYLLGLEDENGIRIESAKQYQDNRKFDIRTNNHKGNISIQ